ncbi:unnamed protein product, partial [Polarella glacialis]
QWLYELKERQSEEMESFQAEVSEPKGGSCAAVSSPSNCEVSVAKEAKEEDDEAEGAEGLSEEEKIRRKKEKAMKKKQGRADKEVQREADKEREKREAGPSRRETELQALKACLRAQRPPMDIREIAADGHCLYRSVGDQLRRLRPDHCFKRPPEEIHDEIRALCASALRRQADSYSPFAELKDGEDFSSYCQRVESSGGWGGELELRALADELKVQIQVFQADA